MVCADAFSLEAGTGDAVRISLGGASDQAVLAQALRTIADLLPQNNRRGTPGIV